jgi:hypothetical protein
VNDQFVFLAYGRLVIGRFGLRGAVILLVYALIWLGLVAATVYVAFAFRGWSRLVALSPGLMVVLVFWGGYLLARDAVRQQSVPLIQPRHGGIDLGQDGNPFE